MFATTATATGRSQNPTTTGHLRIPARMRPQAAPETAGHHDRLPARRGGQRRTRSSTSARRTTRVSNETTSASGSGPRSVQSCGTEIRRPPASQKNVNRPANQRAPNTTSRCPASGWKG